MLNLELDRLMDILYCKCPILLCSEFGCLGKKQKCKCKQNEKIPGMELMFVRAQRSKFGSLSTHMIAGADLPESRKQESDVLKREEKKKAEDEKNRKAEAVAEKKKAMEEAAKKFMYEQENNDIPEVPQEPSNNFFLLLPHSDHLEDPALLKIWLALAFKMGHIVVL